MVGSDQGMDARSVRRVGIITFATLAAWVVVSWSGFVLFGLRRTPVTTAEIAVFLAVSVVVVCNLCLLWLVYLRHLFRSDAAPERKARWVLLLFIFELFAMAYYWSAYMRQPPSPAG
jgi:hypothetical protein